MARKLKIVENEKYTLEDLNNGENTEKREKREIHTVGPGIWRENWNSRKLKITLLGTENDEKYWKTLKLINSHCRT
jgi:hypothetical protein